MINMAPHRATVGNLSIAFLFGRDKIILGIDSMVNWSNHQFAFMFPLQNGAVLIFGFQTMVDRASQFNWTPHSIFFGVVLIAGVNIGVNGSNHLRLMRFPSMNFVLWIIVIGRVNLVFWSKETCIKLRLFFSLREVLALDFDSFIDGSFKSFLGFLDINRWQILVALSSIDAMINRSTPGNLCLRLCNFGGVFHIMINMPPDGATVDNLTMALLFGRDKHILGINSMVDWSNHQQTFFFSFRHWRIHVVDIHWIHRTCCVKQSCHSFRPGVELVTGINVGINGTDHRSFMRFPGCYFVIFVIGIISLALVNRSSHDFLHLHRYIF